MSRTRVYRGVWQVGCPRCSEAVDIAETDIGQYDCIEGAVDCPWCGTRFETETIVLVVVGEVRADVNARADRLRTGARDASEIGGVVADVRARRGTCPT